MTPKRLSAKAKIMGREASTALAAKERHEGEPGAYNKQRLPKALRPTIKEVKLWAAFNRHTGNIAPIYPFAFTKRFALQRCPRSLKNYEYRIVAVTYTTRLTQTKGLTSNAKSAE